MGGMAGGYPAVDRTLKMGPVSVAKYSVPR